MKRRVLCLWVTGALAVGLAMMLVSKFVLQTLALLIVGVGLLALTRLHPLVWLGVPGTWSVIVVNATWRMARKAAPKLNGIDK